MPGVLALCLVALVVLLPGWLLQRALVPSGDPLVRVAAAAPVGLGIVWSLATGLHLLGAPVSSTLMLPALVVLVVVCVVVARRRPAPASRRLDRTDGTDRADRAALLLAGGSMLALVWVSSSALSLAVPNDDGTIHGWMTTRIAELATVSPDVVLSTDVWTDQPGAGFYPLALHTVAAVLHQTGLPVATALNATWLLLVAVSLPAGMHALARTTFPGWRRLPMAAALVAGLVPAVPYTALTWGGIAYAVGLAVVPGVVLLALRAAAGPPAPAQGVVLGVALVGVTFAHTSEVVVAAIVTAGLLIGDPRLRRSVHLRGGTATGLVTAAVLAVGVLPWLSALRAGGAERAVLDLFGGGAGAAATLVAIALLGPLLPAMAAACVVGLVVATRSGRFTGWWVVVGATLVLVVATVVDVPVLRLVTVPFYGLPDRVAGTLLYPSVLGVAVGCWWTARNLALLLGGSRVLPAPASSTVIRAVSGGLVGAVVVGGMVVDDRQKLQTAYVGPDGPGTGASLTTPAALDAFAELARLAPPEARVLNQFSDGSGWMYAVAGAAPLMAAKPDAVGGERLYLLDHAAQVLTDPRAAAALREWSVGYAYVRDQRFPVGDDGPPPPRLRVDELVAGGWTVVWQRDDVTLLKAPAT